MPTEPRDEYMVYTPGNALARHVYGYAAVERALDELGRRSAIVRRVTEGDLARNVTHIFEQPEPDEYPDDEVSQRRHRSEQSRKFTFGTRAFR